MFYCLPLLTLIELHTNLSIQVTLPKTYPVTVPAGSPVLKGLDLVPLAGRNPLLPPLYQYTEPHPYHRIRPKNCKTYVYLVDPSPKGKALYSAIADSMKVPGGPIAGT